MMRPPVMRPVPPPPRARSGGAPAASRTAAQRRAGGLSLWLAVYIVLNIGDLITTNLGLHSGLREGNPLMRALLGQFGFGSLIGYKLLVVAAVLVGIHMLSRRYARLATITLIICNVLVGLAVLLNIVQYVAL
ncbi:MAG: hypothetical protein IVW57_14095 [Ktedonobacterales bacterium]|nr:hypothetical protein [Ktedonobacterales bacterium]